VSAKPDRLSIIVTTASCDAVCTKVNNLSGWVIVRGDTFFFDGVVSEVAAHIGLAALGSLTCESFKWQL
jgi:hypothetical protein